MKTNYLDSLSDIDFMLIPRTSWEEKRAYFWRAAWRSSGFKTSIKNIVTV